MHPHIDPKYNLQICTGTGCTAPYCMMTTMIFYLSPNKTVDFDLCPKCNSYFTSPVQYHLFGGGECSLIHPHAVQLMAPGVNRLRITTKQQIHANRYGGQPYNPGMGITAAMAAAQKAKSTQMADIAKRISHATDAALYKLFGLDFDVDLVNPVNPPKPPSPNITLGFDIMRYCPKCATEYVMLHSCVGLGKGMMIGGVLYPDPPKGNQSSYKYTCPQCGTHYTHYHPCSEVGRIYMGNVSYKASKAHPIELCGMCMDKYQDGDTWDDWYEYGNWRPIDGIFHFAWIEEHCVEYHYLTGGLDADTYQEEEYLCDKEPRRINHITDGDYLTELHDNLRESQMPRMTSTLNDAGTGETVPKGLYNAHVIEVNDMDKNDVGKQRTSKAGAPMVDLTWQIDEGPYADKKIRFDTIMLGGNSKEGKPISLGRLCTFLHFTGVPWECADCRNGERTREFYIAQDTDDDKAKGLKKGNFYCPDCKTLDPRVEYDTANFQGARCGIGVKTEKQEGGDREFNKVSGYTTIRPVTPTP